MWMFVWVRDREARRIPLISKYHEGMYATTGRRDEQGSASVNYLLEARHSFTKEAGLVPFVEGKRVRSDGGKRTKFHESLHGN